MFRKQNKKRSESIYNDSFIICNVVVDLDPVYFDNKIDIEHLYYSKWVFSVRDK